MLEFNHETGVYTEPVAIGGAIMAACAAILAAVMSFGVGITVEQGGYILGAISALIVLVTVIQRSKVVPLTKLDEVS